MATALEYLKECPVCQEEYTDPRVFPCDHSLCFKCFDRMKKGNQIKCPECNAIHNIGKVRRDFRLMQFLDALKEANQSVHPPKKGMYIKIFFWKSLSSAFFEFLCRHMYSNECIWNTLNKHTQVHGRKD